MEILVASKNRIKTEAFRIGLQEVFSPHNITVKGDTAASEINEQPVGLEETYRGAENRIKNAKKLSMQGYDFVGAVENGIYQRAVDGQLKWFDFAWVLLENPQGHVSATMSRTIEIPTDAVMEAMRRGFATTTVGSVISERLNSDPQDPHAALTDGLHPRQQILSEAIEICAFKFKTL